MVKGVTSANFEITPDRPKRKTAKCIWKNGDDVNMDNYKLYFPETPVLRKEILPNKSTFAEIVVTVKFNGIAHANSVLYVKSFAVQYPDNGAVKAIFGY